MLSYYFKRFGLAALVLILLVIVYNCNWSLPFPDFEFDGRIQEPQTAFKHLILNPIPSDITDMQGDGDAWQGHSIYIRFKASNETINRIISSGYYPASSGNILSNFNLPDEYEATFTPQWSPEMILTKESYIMPNVKDGWSTDGTKYMVIDRQNGIVYFYGSSI